MGRKEIAMGDNLKTTLHRYSFSLDRADDARAYAELREKLSATNGECFAVNGTGNDGAPEGPIELETTHLFSNQWNTAPIGESSTGYRVFDWCEWIFYSNGKRTRRRSGYWLEITDEMREIRRNTNVCGYCGHQERAQRGLVFCDRCLDSPYLKPTELHLTRMMSTEHAWPEREPLTDAERAHLMPEYVRRQTTGADSRNAQRLVKQRANVVAKHEKAISDATSERDGMLWLMDRGFPIDNVIYYNHVGRFGFGWQSPVSDEVASEILGWISEFPFPYQIKGISRTWEGG
jgi:hypothetical protein